MIQRYITISYQIYQLQYRLLSSEIWTDLLNWSRVAMDCHLKIKNKEEYLTYRFAGPWVHVRDSIIPPCFEIFPSQLWSMFSLSGKKNCALHWAIPPFFARKGTKHNTLFVKLLWMAMTVYIVHQLTDHATKMPIRWLQPRIINVSFLYFFIYVLQHTNMEHTEYGLKV